VSAAVVLVAGSLAAAFTHGKGVGHATGLATGLAIGTERGHATGYNDGYFRGKAEFAGQYAAGYTSGEQSAKRIKDSLVYHEGVQVGLAEHSRLRAQAARV
jgi:hypothetical protein